MSKVLVIEDDHHIRTTMAQTLSYEGYEVIEAENGLVGVHMAKQHLPDLIICDIMMPELDGYSVLLQLREEPSTAKIPFIFLTATLDKSAMRQGMALGADDYLTKPFMTDDLLSAVNARLERHHFLVKASEHRINELRSNLLLTLPHELRTPLTSIIGYSDLILMNGEKMDRPKMTRLITTINQAGHRLLRMIENYLLYAQIEIIQTDPERVKEFQRFVVEQPADIITNAAMKKGHEVWRESDLTFELGNARLCVSEESLHKIAGELVDNALKFSENGTPVEIKTGVEGGYYLLQVSDQGHGMTSEQIQSIGAYMQFERKLHEQQGVGLGLVIVKRLLDLHRGSLHIDSIYGQQTSVTVKIPLSR